jgi:hypothetical protein
VRTLRVITLSLLFILAVAPLASAQLEPTTPKTLTVDEAWLRIKTSVDKNVTDPYPYQQHNWSNAYFSFTRELWAVVNEMNYEDALTLIEKITNLDANNRDGAFTNHTKIGLDGESTYSYGKPSFSETSSWKRFLTGIKVDALETLADVGTKRAWLKIIEHLSLQRPVKDLHGSTIAGTARKLLKEGWSPEKEAALNEAYASLVKGIKKASLRSFLNSMKAGKINSDLEVRSRRPALARFEEQLGRINVVSVVKERVQEEMVESAKTQAKNPTHFLPVIKAVNNGEGEQIKVEYADPERLFLVLKAAKDFGDQPFDLLKASPATHEALANLWAKRAQLRNGGNVYWLFEEELRQDQRTNGEFVRLVDYLREQGMPIEVITHPTTGPEERIDETRIFETVTEKPAKAAVEYRLGELTSSFERFRDTRNNREPSRADLDITKRDVMQTLRFKKAIRLVKEAAKEVKP